MRPAGWCCPAASTAMCTLRSRRRAGIVMADDFESGTRAAAFGGNTMVLPFACSRKARSLRQVVQDYHAQADGECHVDVSFHLIIADATEHVLGQELPALVQ